MGQGSEAPECLTLEYVGGPLDGTLQSFTRPLEPSVWMMKATSEQLSVIQPLNVEEPAPRPGRLWHVYNLATWECESGWDIVYVYDRCEVEK